MARPKKEAKMLSMKLDVTVYDLLDRFSDETGIPKTTAVEKILNQFFAEYYARPDEERSIFK